MEETRDQKARERPYAPRDAAVRAVLPSGCSRLPSLPWRLLLAAEQVRREWALLDEAA